MANTKGAKTYIKKNETRLGPPPKDIKKNVLPKNKSLPKKRNSNESGTVGNRDRSSNSSSRTDSKSRPPVLKAHGRVEKRAKRLTQGIIRGEVRDLRSQKKEIKRAAKDARQVTNTSYERGVGDLQHINNEVVEQIGRSTLQSQQAFDATKTQQAAAAAALQNQLGSIYGNVQQDASQDLSSLGMDSSQFLGRLSSDQANMQGLAAVEGANAQSNLGFANQNSQQLSGLLQGMAAGSFMSNFGQNLNARNDSLAATATEKSNQLNLVRDAIADAKGSRKDVFLELLTQLEQSGWGKNLGSGGNRGVSHHSTTKTSGEKDSKNDGPKEPPKFSPPKKKTPSKKKHGPTIKLGSAFNLLGPR